MTATVRFQNACCAVEEYCCYYDLANQVDDSFATITQPRNEPHELFVLLQSILLIFPCLRMSLLTLDNDSMLLVTFGWGVPRHEREQD